jgi:hemolysin-activating ACP:hemolysin acyltransferase
MLFGKKTSTEESAKQQQAETPLAEGGATNGAHAPAASKPAALSEDEAKKRAAAAKQIAAGFGEIVTLLMRSPTDKHHTLGDLEWLVVPALAHRQYALAEAQSKETGAVSPVGGVLWAFVSEEVDKRLSDLSTPVRLKPNEWRSGDIPWIIMATGDMRILAGLIQQLNKSVFKDKQPKMRVRGKDGKVSVGHLEVKEKPADAA